MRGLRHAAARAPGRGGTTLPARVTRLVGLIAIASAGAAAAAFGLGGTATVSMSHTGPIPAVVTVVPHSTVMWVNDDTDNHSIISSGSGFTSPVIQPGQTYSIVVGLPGKIAYQQTGFGR